MRGRLSFELNSLFDSRALIFIFILIFSISAIEKASVNNETISFRAKMKDVLGSFERIVVLGMLSRVK